MLVLIIFLILLNANGFIIPTSVYILSGIIIGLYTIKAIFDILKYFMGEKNKKGGNYYEI